MAATKDGQIVVLHDETINRTARTSDGRKLTENIRISDITYEEAAQYDYGFWFLPEFKGEKIPLFSEVLEFADGKDIHLKIDNKFLKMDEESIQKLFEMVKQSDAKVGFSCNDIECVEFVLENWSDAYIHLGGKVNKEILEEVSKLVPKERLTIWIPYESSQNAWVTDSDFANEELCELTQKYGHLGIWMLISDIEYDDVMERFNPDIIETNGNIKPQKVRSR